MHATDFKTLRKPITRARPSLVSASVVTHGGTECVVTSIGPGEHEMSASRTDNGRTITILASDIAAVSFD